MRIKSLNAEPMGKDIRLDITVDAENLEEALDASYVMTGQKMELASTSLEELRDSVNSLLTGEQIAIELRENVPGFIVPFALTELDLFPALEALPVGIPFVVPGEDYSFSVLVRPLPELELSSYEPVEIEFGPFELTDRDVQAKMEEIVSKNVSYEEIEPRKIAEDDLIVLDLVLSIDGVVVEDMTRNGMLLPLGKAFMPLAFEQSVVGMFPGETKSFSFEGPVFDERGSRSTVIADATVTVVSVMKEAEAVLSDEWVARHFPRYGDVDRFREAVRADLTKKLTDDYNRQKDYVSARALISRLVGEIDDEYFEFARDLLRKSSIDEIEARGIQAEQYFAQKENDAHEHNLIIMMQARELIKRDYALDALYRHLGFTLDDDDIFAALHQMAPGNEGQARADYEAMGRMYEVRQAARRLKANRWLSEHAIMHYEADDHAMAPTSGF